MDEAFNSGGSLSAQANAAMEQVVQSVLERARRTGTPVVLWLDDQVQLISADEVEMRRRAGAGNPTGEAVMGGVVGLEEAGLRLKEIIAGLEPDAAVTIVAGGEPIATLRRAGRTSWPCQPGTAQGSQHGMAPDFNAPMEDSREHTE
jgi:hypothetical protein